MRRRGPCGGSGPPRGGCIPIHCHTRRPAARHQARLSVLCSLRSLLDNITSQASMFLTAASPLRHVNAFIVPREAFTS